VTSFPQLHDRMGQTDEMLHALPPTAKKRTFTIIYQPVDADSSQVEYRCGTASDVKGDPRVTESIAQLPRGFVHLDSSHFILSF